MTLALLLLIFVVSSTMNKWRLEQASLKVYTSICFKSAGLIMIMHVWKREAALCIYSFIIQKSF